MQQSLLPLFPLPVVLLPGTALPLHIFEERYKEMVREVLETGAEFGVVLAREKGILNAGCTAAIEKVLKEYPDGRMDILTLGRRRFEVLSLDEEKSYLRGAVEFFEDEAEPEEPAASAELRQQAFEAYKALADVEAPGDASEDMPLTNPQLSFQLAHVVENVDFRQRLLRLRSETERLKQLAAFCRQELPRQRILAHLRRVQPLNGHGRIPISFPDQP